VATASDTAALLASRWWRAVDYRLLSGPDAGSHRCTGTHSRLADGRRLCWDPPVLGRWRVVLDAELAEQVVPPALARRLAGAGDPWGAWTRAEVCSKLFDVPVVVWVTTRGWPPVGPVSYDGAALTVATLRREGLVVSVGARRVG
jgi:hypothetical protein